MDAPKFLISGQDRRAKKKKLNELKRFVKMFRFYEDIDRVYGGGLDDETCNELINDAKNQITGLQHEISLTLN
jgi:hypothetical protein